ncbi:MAG: hypothetical protein C5B53_12065 [Candidatus Melainabacteria bacterium]|nr:MAG: hypothetical protein C5B53_12065 [Candidatus Melainabacteria bacterium]
MCIFTCVTGDGIVAGFVLKRLQMPSSVGQKTLRFALILLFLQTHAVEAAIADGNDRLPVGYIEQPVALVAQSPGAVFTEPDRVMVKEPLLKALIQLNDTLSPYQLDASSQVPISFQDVLKAALANNLPLKMSRSSVESKHWQFRGALAQFLPDISTGINAQEIRGNFASPFGIVAPINSPFVTVPNTFNMYFFRGGSILYGALRRRHEWKAAQYELKGTTNDVLYQAAKLYWQLALNDVLLQVRISALEKAQAAYELNKGRNEHGFGTKLDVLQAQSEVSRYRQNLIVQQVIRRQAAVDLATALNLDPSVDYFLKDRLVASTRLVDANLNVNKLVDIAIDNRPELKQYEYLRLAAKDAIKVARAPLLPKIVGSAGVITTGADVFRNSTLSQSAAPASSFTIGPNGVPILAPIAVNTSGSRSFRMTENYFLGISLVWALNNMGLSDIAAVKSAKWDAIKAADAYRLQLTKVYQEVRNAYLECLKSANLLIETTNAINSGSEQMDVATKRLEEGLGNELDLLTAQDAYTAALIDKARAILEFNMAEAALLRATGRISIETLTSSIPIKS